MPSIGRASKAIERIFDIIANVIVLQETVVSVRRLEIYCEGLSGKWGLRIRILKLEKLSG